MPGCKLGRLTLSQSLTLHQLEVALELIPQGRRMPRLLHDAVEGRIFGDGVTHFACIYQSGCCDPFEPHNLLSVQHLLDSLTVEMVKLATFRLPVVSISVSAVLSRFAPLTVALSGSKEITWQMPNTSEEEARHLLSHLMISPCCRVTLLQQKMP